MRLYGRNTVKPYDLTNVKPHTDMEWNLLPYRKTV